MKRRTAIKNLSVLPVAGVAVGTILPLESVLAAPVTPPAPKRDFIKELDYEHLSMQQVLTPL